MKKSEREHVRHFLHKTCKQEVSGSFTLESCKITAKKSTKKCAARAKLLLLIRPIVYFSQFSGVAYFRRLALHHFVFCLNKL